MAKKSFDNPTLLLIEHGETEFSGDDDKSERIHGTKYDLPLTWKGHQQAADMAEKLSKHDIASVDTSPMKRATETAEHITEATGVKARPDEGMKPLDSGYLSGMNHEQAHRRIEYYVANPHKQIPGGESYGDWWDLVTSRMAKRLKEVKAIHKKSGQGAVDVLHSSEIASMPNIIRGDDPAMWTGKKIPGPGQISAVQEIGGKWKYSPHWEG